MKKFAMVEAYWNIGKSIIEEQGGHEKAEKVDTIKDALKHFEVI